MGISKELQDQAGTFTQLTREQLRRNAGVVIPLALTAAIPIAGVTVAVSTGIVWIAAVSAAIWIAALAFVLRAKKSVYTPRFGRNYNLIRFGVAGMIIYQQTVWQGIAGLYNRLRFVYGPEVSAPALGWSLTAVLFLLFAGTNLALNRVTDSRLAMFLGFVEAISAAILLGAAIFLAIYA